MVTPEPTFFICLWFYKINMSKSKHVYTIPFWLSLFGGSLWLALVKGCVLTLNSPAK